VFEANLSGELISRAANSFPKLLVQLAPPYPPKLIALSSDRSAHGVDLSLEQLEDRMESVIERIERAKFTGKGDQLEVVSLYTYYAGRIMDAFCDTLAMQTTARRSDAQTTLLPMPSVVAPKAERLRLPEGQQLLLRGMSGFHEGASYYGVVDETEQGVRRVLAGASGLKWRRTGGEKPNHGEELKHKGLASGLTKRTEFTREEWDAFGIKDLRMEHFIKSGPSYFQPAAGYGSELYFDTCAQVVLPWLPDAVTRNCESEHRRNVDELIRLCNTASKLSGELPDDKALVKENKKGIESLLALKEDKKGKKGIEQLYDPTFAKILKYLEEHLLLGMAVRRRRSGVSCSTVMEKMAPMMAWPTKGNHFFGELLDQVNRLQQSIAVVAADHWMNEARLKAERNVEQVKHELDQTGQDASEARERRMQNLQVELAEKTKELEQKTTEWKTAQDDKQTQKHLQNEKEALRLLLPKVRTAVSQVKTEAEGLAAESLRAGGAVGVRRYVVGQLLTVRICPKWCDAEVEETAREGSFVHIVRCQGDATPVSLELHPWSHAPRELPMEAFEALRIWHIQKLRASHAFIVDALSGAKLDALEQCIPIGVIKQQQQLHGKGLHRHEPLQQLFRKGLETIGNEGYVKYDAKSLSVWLREAHETRLAGGACNQPCATRLTAGPAAGKTTLLSQVVMLSLDGELVPILVKVQRLQQRLIDSPDAFASAWNFVDAFLRLEHSENIEYYRMLRQAMMARRALVLLDGLDEGGQKRTEIERHVTEVLAPQGHVMLCTSRPQGDDAAARFAAFRRLELLPLSDEQQEEALKQRLGVEAIKVLRPYIHDKVPRDENGNRVTANPLMCAIASRVHTPLTSSLPYPYQPYRCVVSSLVLDCWRRLSMVASVYTLFKGRVDENRVRIPMPKTIVDLYANASDAMLARGGVTSPALRELLQAVLLLAHMMKRREFGVEHIDMAATIVGSSRETLDEMHTRVALDQLPLLTVLQADPLLLQSSHLSFQEFFAAKGLCAQGTVLRGEPPWQWPVWWWNALRFGTEMDGFRRGLLSAAGVTSGNLNLCGQLGGHRPMVLKVVAEFVAVLTSLDLSHNDLDENAGKVLASALRSTGVLTSLNLSANRLCGVYHERGERCGSYTATGISEICLALKNNACLTSLNLSWNMLSGFRDNLQDSAVKAICELLTFNAALSWLDLSHNTLGAEGAEAIAAVLPSNTGVHMINLDGFALPVKQPHLVRTLALSNKRSRGLLSRIVITRLMESRQSHNSGEHKPPASLATAKLLAPTIAHGHASASAATCELDKEVKARLLELDDSLHLALKQGDIRLVRVAWLQQRPDTYRIQCRQELEALDNVSPSPLMTSQEAVDLICSGGRAVGALTYGWCSPGRPDPTGVRVQILRSALARFPHIKAIFWECATARSRTALSRTIVSLCSHTKHPFWQFPLALSEPGRRPAQR
jgi:hypothetical protein